MNTWTIGSRTNASKPMKYSASQTVAERRRTTVVVVVHSWWLSRDYSMQHSVLYVPEVVYIVSYYIKWETTSWTYSMFILTLAVRRNEKLVHVQTVWLLSAGLMVTMGGRPWSKAYLEKKLKQLNQVTTFLPRIKKLYLNNQLFMKDETTSIVINHPLCCVCL